MSSSEEPCSPDSLIPISHLGSRVQLRRCGAGLFERLAQTLKAHWQGILNAFDLRLANGPVKRVYAEIQAAKARARGFRRI